MRGIWGWVGLLAVLLLGAAFAAANAGRMVIIDLGLFTLYRVPVTFVAFGGMVVGMGVMLMAGIHSDLKVRALLRQRREGGADRRLPESGAAPEEDRTDAAAPVDPSELSGPPNLSPRAPLSDPPPELPDSWDRSRQSELPIE